MSNYFPHFVHNVIRWRTFIQWTFSHTHTKTLIHNGERTYKRNQMKINVWHSILQQNLYNNAFPAAGDNRQELFVLHEWTPPFNAIRHWHCSMRHIYRRTDCRRCSDVLSNVAWTQRRTQIDANKSNLQIIWWAHDARGGFCVIYYIASSIAGNPLMITNPTHVLRICGICRYRYPEHVKVSDLFPLFF